MEPLDRQEVIKHLLERLRAGEEVPVTIDGQPAGVLRLDQPGCPLRPVTAEEVRAMYGQFPFGSPEQEDWLRSIGGLIEWELDNVWERHARQQARKNTPPPADHPDTQPR